MQIRTDFTEEELKRDSDPLFLLCYPIDKLKLVSDLLISFDRGKETRAFDGFDGSACVTVGIMISDAVREIEAVVEAANHQYNRLSKENQEVIEKLRKTLMPTIQAAINS